MHSIYVIAFITLTVISARSINGQCRRKPYLIKKFGVGCRKPCTNDADCFARKKRCLCDGVCGMTCFNPNASCPRPDSIDNGIVKVTSLNIGGKANYSCNSGFGMKGFQTRICYARKKWYPPAPTCESFSKCGQPWTKGEDTASLGLVVGGSDAQEGAWPWQVLIAHSSLSMEQSLRYCFLGGGSIVNRNWILTAAHLFSRHRIKSACSSEYVLYVGISERQVKESVQAFSVDKYYQHNGFDDTTYINDIAMVKVGNKLDERLLRMDGAVGEINFGYHVRPICLPCTGNIHEEHLILVDDSSQQRCLAEEQFLHNLNTDVVLTGFGHTKRSDTNVFAAEPSQHLKQAPITIATYQTCRQAINRMREEGIGNLEYSNSFLCSKHGSIDACKGDSGGPLVKKVINREIKNMKWIQIGIVSFGYGCASRYPGYYTNVAKFISWINETMNGNSPDRKCPTPPRERPNAYPSTTLQNMYLPGDHVIYRCKNNYKLKYHYGIETSVSSNCMEGSHRSHWSEDFNGISCIEIVCSSPSLTRNQHLINEKSQWRVGEKAVVRCNDGFDFSEKNIVHTVTCGNNEQWSDTFTSCQGGVKVPIPAHSLYPDIGDLLVGREGRLSASSTCGQNGPDNYCIISPLNIEEKCFVCDASSPSTNHDVENVITTFRERLGTWWKSENGVDQVSIRLDLETSFHFTHLIMTFKTFRPAAMLIERSNDYGLTWRVYRYFAYDCSEHFPELPQFPPREIDDVICDSRYSQIEPITEGEVIYKVLEPSLIPSVDPYSMRIQDLLTITNLRINLTHMHTLGSDLLDNPKWATDIHYYALYELVVRGYCSCNGHADECIPIDASLERPDLIRRDLFQVNGKCVCQHNTFGLNCNECLPFYHDQPWRPAYRRQPNECKRCNCNNHADKCHFDTAVWEANARKSGGVCDDCRDNTMGQHCELCVDGFFLHPDRNIGDPNVCEACNCEVAGSTNGGMCDLRTEPEQGMIAGRCHCKEWVEGERCDRCKPGYFNLEESNDHGCTPAKRNLDLAVLIPANSGHSKADIASYKDWLKEFGKSIALSNNIRLSLYLYGRNRRGRNLFRAKTNLSLGTLSLDQFQSDIDNLSLKQRIAYPYLTENTIASVKRKWGKVKSPGWIKVLIVLVERTIDASTVRNINSRITCLQFKGVIVYFIGTGFDWTSNTFESRLRDSSGDMFSYNEIVQYAELARLASEDSIQSSVGKINALVQNAVCPAPTDPPQPYRGQTCRWKFPLEEQTIGIGNRVFLECKYPSWRRWKERRDFFTQCPANATWIGSGYTLCR